MSSRFRCVVGLVICLAANRNARSADCHLVSDAATGDVTTADAVSNPADSTAARQVVAEQTVPSFVSSEFKDVSRLFDATKDMHLDFLDGLSFLDGSTVTFGGELRHRHHNENNRLRPGGPGRSTYDLWRWRNWLDFKAQDNFRVYVEMMDASIFNQELPITGIDKNRWDIYGAFVDLKVLERDAKPVIFRVGRQDLLFGKQRLVSPLEFGNTRRNFEGFRVTSRGETWDIDAFSTRPVNTATGHGPLARFVNRPARADASRTFSGVYGTYHGGGSQLVDVYWLWLREQDELPARVDGSRHTVGARWADAIEVLDECCQPTRAWSWDLEGGYQFGHEANQVVRAGFFAADVAHQWKQIALKPKLGGVFYYASGDDNPFDGENNTFDDLFPLGHAYWGLIDNLSAQNLLDYSVQATVFPSDKINFLTAVHWFDRANRGDVIYNVANAPLGTVATASKNIGSELDLVLNYKFDDRLNVQLLYSWFWYGGFVVDDPAIRRDDASLFYLQSQLRY